MAAKCILKMKDQELEKALLDGARCVVYEYCISIIILSLKKSSRIYLIPLGQRGVTKGIGYSLISILLGWWGYPWGPIYTIGSLITNFRGGKDVSNDVLFNLQHLNNQQL